MPNFSFRNIGTEPEPPSGEHDWRFKLVGSEEYCDVPADTPVGAWEAIRYEKGKEWSRWILYGRTDCVEAGIRSLMVASQFAQAHPTMVERWAENDADG